MITCDLCRADLSREEHYACTFCNQHLCSDHVREHQDLMAHDAFNSYSMRSGIWFLEQSNIDAKEILSYGATQRNASGGRAAEGRR